MEHIRAYQKLTDIKPKRHKTINAFDKASNLRFIFNMQDQELQYDRNHGVWLDPEKVKKIGGGDGEPTRRVAVLMFAT